MSINLQSRLPYPYSPKSVWAVIIPWAITFTMLYFDFLENYKTNPIVLFSIPIIFSLIFMRNESFETLSQSFGLVFKTVRDYIAQIIAIVSGAITGYLIYWALSLNLAIIPLYFLPLSMTLTSILMTYAVVAFGEEIMSIQFAKILINIFYLRGYDEMTASVFGWLVSRAFWAGLHYFSYGFFDLHTLPLFITAISILH